MDIFRSVTQTVLGNQPVGTQPSGAETIEKLLDRVQSSTLLEDRRNGCRALKSLSKRYRLFVGAHGMDTLIQVLESDRNDHEIVNLALETLVNVMSDEAFTEEGEDYELKEVSQSNIGEQFTEIFTKRSENISMVISLLDEFDFKVRYPAMKLLTNLLRNRPKEIQEEILVIPSGISKLMDMLMDSREVIRNDTLLLLTQLTDSNTSLQKIVAFENAFDHLFDIMKAEGYTEGGVVVEDCLVLTISLLKNNPSNQTLFKEGVYIQQMTEFFNFLPDNSESGVWTPQKVAIVHYMMRLVCILVAPQNSAQIVFDCQKKMKNCGLIDKLCSLLMAGGVPADILTDTIIATSEVIRGNKDNQEFFASVSAPSNPPRPAVVVLLLSMTDEKQPFVLRCAVLFCFGCFLYKNPTIQGQVVQTLLPQTIEANQVTAGQLLCGGLFNNDPVCNWFSAIALSHALLDNTALKEQLLRVQLATGAGAQPVSLLQHCTSLLQGGSKLLTRLGVLQLLCIWVSHCPIAVSHLLTLPSVVPHLTAYLSANEHDEMEIICQGICAFLLGLCSYFNDGSVTNFTKDSLAQLIFNRVGLENFTDKLENILKTEAYSRAAKSPQLNAKQPSAIVFDYQFTKVFKHLEASALKAISNSEMSSHEEISAEIENYKTVIRDQDSVITRLKERLQETENQLIDMKKESEKKDVSIPLQNGPLTPSNGDTDQSQRINLLEKQLQEVLYARDYYYYQMVEKDNMLQNAAQTSTENGGDTTTTSNAQMETLQQQLQDLQLALYRKDEEIREVKDQSVKVLNPSKENENSNSLSTDLETALNRITEITSKANELEEELERYKAHNEELRNLKVEYDKLHSGQEDLLILLSDQDAKLKDYKKLLSKLGQEVSSDDDAEEEIDSLQ